MNINNHDFKREEADNKKKEEERIEQLLTTAKRAPNRIHEKGWSVVDQEDLRVIISAKYELGKIWCFCSLCTDEAERQATLENRSVWE